MAASLSARTILITGLLILKGGWLIVVITVDLLPCLKHSLISFSPLFRPFTLCIAPISLTCRNSSFGSAPDISYLVKASRFVASHVTPISARVAHRTLTCYLFLCDNKLPLSYFFLLLFFAASLRIVPSFLSPLVSLPSGFLIVPGGSPCFFSRLPTVMSLRSLRGFLAAIWIVSF